MNWRILVGVLVIAGVATAGLLFQHCMYDKKLAEKERVREAASTELVAAKKQLQAEHVAAARAKAKATVRKAQENVASEVKRAEDDSDLYEFLSSVSDGGSN